MFTTAATGAGAVALEVRALSKRFGATRVPRCLDRQGEGAL